MPVTEELVRRLEREIPGYNLRPLDLDDLDGLCEREGVVLVRHPFPGLGLTFRRHGHPVIAVNDTLPAGHAAFVGFHEYFHHLFHPGTAHYYAGSPNWLNKIEAQASVLAALAVWPTPLLVRDLEAGQTPARPDDLPDYVVELRLKAHAHYLSLLRARQGGAPGDEGQVGLDLIAPR